MSACRRQRAQASEDPLTEEPRPTQEPPLTEEPRPTQEPLATQGPGNHERQRPRRWRSLPPRPGRWRASGPCPESF